MILFDISELHIEISSRCVLKCPRCPRTELSKELKDVLNTDYSLTDFKRIFTPLVLDKVERILFCGDKGDPIYAKDFLQIVQYIKEYKPNLRISITTNGSYKSSSWWTELGESLSPLDTITFSVDGLNSTKNNMYRVNSDMLSIIDGMIAISKISEHKRPFMVWSTIRFRFNQDDIQKNKFVFRAKELNFDRWQLVESTKVGSIDQQYLDENGYDHLEPININKASSLKVYKKRSHSLSKRKEHVNYIREAEKNKLNGKDRPWQSCLRKEQIPMIDVDGKFYPCAWFNSGYIPNAFVEKYANEINIRKNGFESVINNSCWKELETQWLMAPLEICKLKCYKNA